MSQAGKLPLYDLEWTDKFQCVVAVGVCVPVVGSG